MGRNKKNKNKQSSSTNVTAETTEVPVENPYSEPDNSGN